jgi:hypothetical protein
MYMARDLMYCKPGKAKDLVAIFKRLSEVLTGMGYAPMRVYTDVSGEPYWTVVAEQEIKTLDDLAEKSRQAMSDPKLAEIFKGYHDLVTGGRREFYKVEF